MWWLLAVALGLQGDRMLFPGQPVAGVLSDSSAPVRAFGRAELFGFQCISGLGLRVDAVSAWDNRAFILAPDGRVVVQNDDDGGANNARIAWACPGNQLYRVGVASYHAGTGGAFTLTVTVTSDVGVLPKSDDVRRLGPDADVRGTLTAATARYLNHPIAYYEMRCARGMTVRMELISDFDNLLYVFGPSGELATNDDANGTNAGLVYRCLSAGPFRIGVAAQNAGDGGVFRLLLRNLSDPDVALPAPARPRVALRTAFPGAVVDGTLHAADTLFYALQCQAGLPLRITVSSRFDNAVLVVGPAGSRVAMADNAAGTSDASLAWRCPDAQVYRIGVVAANGSGAGAFTLSVQPAGAASADTPPVVPAPAGTLYAGARINGNLLGRVDVYVLHCAPRLALRIDMRSAFDNVLKILDGAGREVASNDDTRGTDASLTWTCPDAAEYRVGAGSRHAATGRYTITVR